MNELALRPHWAFSSFPHIKEEFFTPIDSIMDSMFAEFFSDIKPFKFDSIKSRTYPKVDVFKDGNNIVLEASVPFVDPKDLKVELNKDVLVISGKVNQENLVKDRYFYKRELTRSSFKRGFPINEELFSAWTNKTNGDPQVDAELKNGILTVKLVDILDEKEKPPEITPKKINIRLSE